MAMFHSHIQVISRSSGRSSVAAAAYRSGTCITDERTGAVHDYTRKDGVVYSEIVLPEAAPRRWLDRSTLWNEVERTEKSSNAQLSREIEYALPRKLDRDRQIALARKYAKSFAEYGMVADFSIHDKGDGNPHVHMMLTMRPCDESGFTEKSVNEYLVRNVDGSERWLTSSELKAAGSGWQKVYRYRDGRELTQAEAELNGLHPTKDRKGKAAVQTTRYLVDWNDPKKAVEWRERLAKMQNDQLTALGYSDRIDHRSYADQDIDRIPTLHEGVTVRRAEANEQSRAHRMGYEYQPITDRRRENIRIRNFNNHVWETLKNMMEKTAKVRQSLTRSRLMASQMRRRGRNRVVHHDNAPSTKRYSGLNK